MCCYYAHCYFLIWVDILAAFEVYVRRAYRAYTLLSIDYEEGDGVDDGELPSVVTWRFNLGQSHSPPSTPRLTFGSVLFILARRPCSDRKAILARIADKVLSAI